MRKWLIALAVAASVGSAAAQAQRPQNLQPGRNADWSPERQPQGAMFRSGNITLTFRNDPDPEIADLPRPALTVAMPGYQPVTLHGESVPAYQDHRVSVGRWSADGTPFVFFQSFSGGAHCCTSLQVVVPQAGQLRVYDLGEWDGGYADDVPKDEDGDGTVDFLQVDNGFLYAFASYAESFAPPVVYNIVNGEAVDVSGRPGFRRFFESAARDARRLCVSREDSNRNGACAAYVAASARLGRFEQAWAEMLENYHRSAEWELPSSCRVENRDEACPEDQRVEFTSYPDALRAFLQEQGYIPRAG